MGFEGGLAALKPPFSALFHEGEASSKGWVNSYLLQYTG
jgi:hypothetical protein